MDTKALKAEIEFLRHIEASCEGGLNDITNLSQPGRMARAYFSEMGGMVNRRIAKLERKLRVPNAD